MLLLCGLFGCVEKAQYEAVQKELNDTKRNLSATQEELKKTKEQISEYQKHKYQVFHNGSRTWRFDTVTGKSCILLASKADWKKPDTSRQSCDCENEWQKDNPSDSMLKIMGCL